jgi:hypothetical protein
VCPASAILRQRKAGAVEVNSRVLAFREDLHWGCLVSGLTDAQIEEISKYLFYGDAPLYQKGQVIKNPQQLISCI